MKLPICRVCGKELTPQPWCPVCGGDHWGCHCVKDSGACDPGRCEPVEAPPPAVPMHRLLKYVRLEQLVAMFKQRYRAILFAPEPGKPPLGTVVFKGNIGDPGSLADQVWEELQRTKGADDGQEDED